MNKDTLFNIGSGQVRNDKVLVVVAAVVMMLLLDRFVSTDAGSAAASGPRRRTPTPRC